MSVGRGLNSRIAGAGSGGGGVRCLHMIAPLHEWSSHQARLFAGCSVIYEEWLE